MNIFDNIIDINIEKNMSIVGCTDDFFALYLNSIFNKNNKNILVVTSNLYEATKLYNLISNLNDKVFLFPMDDFLTSEAVAISPELKLNRLETLDFILNEDKGIYITNLMGYLRYLPTIDTYKNSFINLNISMEIDPKELINKLERIGYNRNSIVTNVGEYAVRGFILDIFPIGEENPMRIEFFGDEIESIRCFSSNTQKSINTVNNLIVKPNSEFIFEKEVVDIEQNNKNLEFVGDVSNLYNYLDNPYTFFKDYNQITVTYENLLNEMFEYKSTKDLDYKGNYMNGFLSIYVNYPVYYNSIDNISNNNDISKSIDFKVETITPFFEDVDRINTYIRNCINKGKTVVLCLLDYQYKNIIKILNMKVNVLDNNSLLINEVNYLNKSLNKGFCFNNYVFISAYELFNVKSKPKKSINKFKYATTISDINKLSIGDYIVHNTHGIGIYNGIKTLTIGNIIKDYIEVLYKNTDKLYIPVEKIDLLFKYSGKEGMVPKVNSLSGNEWEKTKARVKNKVSDMADRLIKLYAERESKVGYAFSKNNELMEDFKNRFAYDLTKDQVTSINQITLEMEKSVPMDKLLCGDVGFGKTEVAFVAAFKAMVDSKQVLYLCPTTILAKQHYSNAIERFKDFPVRIEILSRFSTPNEVKKILEGLSDGTIDMVIGTHRLLSDDIKIKDLGLLIIDEEQRFGVSHKEKLKEYKSNVDVLTLTATPIPRTLQMSMVGIRSLSLISTPPVNRYPVQTYVVEENDLILKDVIYKEMTRNGQVFILYNKVSDIEKVVSKVRSLVPSANVDYAHGKMTKNELENRILSFTNKEFDILVCTTIIETGIDIPNVNTLIILDSDRFGLSQLYQIRGRVGRSDKIAYAYLMYKPNKLLTETAVKRLNVIKEFTALGSGFSIAARDLSIRGAGDILGSEQAGFIDSVGIDLYLKMLNDEINYRNNGKLVEEEINSKPLINVSTHISDNYVKEDELKIEIHKLINEVNSLEKLNNVKIELEDRFGKLDEDLIIYMYEEWFEKLVNKFDIKQVKENKNSIELVFKNLDNIKIDDLFVLAFNVSTMFRFKSLGSNLIIVLDTIKLDKHPIYYLVELLVRMEEEYK